jgi:hypothetical protein
MPASVNNAAPVGVLPQSLCTAFSERREWASRVNEYHDGARQMAALVSTSRRSWSIRKRLKPTVLQALWTFWAANQHTAFYFYNPKDVLSGYAVGSNYDATGVSTQGRYTVRFNGDWNQSTYIPRADCTLELIEVA